MAGYPCRRAAESGMTATREQLLEVARRAAPAAGEAILQAYATAFDVQHKTDNTPVCEGDLASERIIVAMLSEAFPEIPIASEELVEAEGLPPWAARFWAVDPLDGTKEFVARNNEFAVLIALIEDGIPSSASFTARRSASLTRRAAPARLHANSGAANPSRSRPASRRRTGSSSFTAGRTKTADDSPNSCRTTRCASARNAAALSNSA
jgi:3'-phosphoadenosine 5'-phosphosulfate (PAPS) 3'-phosphatase